MITADFLTSDAASYDETELDAATIDVFDKEFGSDGAYSFKNSEEVVLSEGFSEGHDFYRLTRIEEAVSPLSFDTDNRLSRELPVFEPGIATEEPEEEPAEEPTLVELREFTVVNIFSNSNSVSEGDTARYTITQDQP